MHKFSLKPVVIVFGIILFDKTQTASMKREFMIQKTWNNKDTGHDPIKITLSESPCGDIKLSVSAPFFNSPGRPDGPAGQPFDKLWDYEVVEAFFLNGKNQYLEVELCPHGQHLVLLLNGRRNMVKHLLPLSFTASINDNTWEGEAVIPIGYLPSDVTKFNAYAIHGEGNDRQYEALYPLLTPKNTDQPDFHRLELFQPLDMNTIVSSYDSTKVFPIWKQVLGL